MSKGIPKLPEHVVNSVLTPIEREIYEMLRAKPSSATNNQAGQVTQSDKHD